MIEMELPLDLIAAQVEMDEMCKKHEGDIEDRPPSLFSQLREAVSATPEMSVRVVLEAAIEKCKAAKKEGGGGCTTEGGS